MKLPKWIISYKCFQYFYCSYKSILIVKCVKLGEWCSRPREGGGKYARVYGAMGKGTFLRKRHWSQKTALISNSENIFNLTSYVKPFYHSDLYGYKNVLYRQLIFSLQTSTQTKTEGDRCSLMRKRVCAYVEVVKPYRSWEIQILRSKKHKNVDFWPPPENILSVSYTHLTLPTIYSV